MWVSIIRILLANLIATNIIIMSSASTVKCVIKYAVAFEEYARFATVH